MVSVAGHQAKYPTRFSFIATDDFSNIHRDKVGQDDPSGPKHMNMRGGMVIVINHKPQTISAQNRRHRYV